jgi:hypothetical protein
MVELNTNVIIKTNTKQRFITIQKELQLQNPDLRANQDYTLRKLMDKYEGDSQ